MGQSCSKQHDEDQRLSQETRKKATATIGATYSSTVFGYLDDSGGLLQQMLDSIDEGYVYYLALACQPSHTAIRDRLPNGTRTTPPSVLSSRERFMWAHTELPKEARPP